MTPVGMFIDVSDVHKLKALIPNYSVSTNTAHDDDVDGWMVPIVVTLVGIVTDFRDSHS